MDGGARDRRVAGGRAGDQEGRQAALQEETRAQEAGRDTEQVCVL